MTDSVIASGWRDGGSYEAYVGRWSRRVAVEFVHWLGIPAQSRWLDVGCGTGALSEAILDHGDPQLVVGVEPSDGFRAVAARALGDRVRLEEGTAERLPVSGESFDAVVSGLVLNFVPDQAAGLAEMGRVAAPGATIAAYVWDYAEGMQFMKYFWEAAAGLEGADEFDEGERFPICHPDALHGLFSASGLDDVVVRPVDIPTRFSSFDDYWRPFLGGAGVAPAYLASLDEKSRLALRKRLRRALPVAADGAIPLTARAWVVRGLRA